MTRKIARSLADLGELRETILSEEAPEAPETKKVVSKAKTRKASAKSKEHVVSKEEPQKLNFAMMIQLAHTVGFSLFDPQVYGDLPMFVKTVVETSVGIPKPAMIGGGGDPRYVFLNALVHNNAVWVSNPLAEIPVYSTRDRSLMTILEDLPAICDGVMVRIGTRKNDPDLVSVNHPREASKAKALFDHLGYTINAEALRNHETAHITPEAMLRMKVHMDLRANTPDIGVLFVLDLLHTAVETDNPLNLERLNRNTIQWIASGARSLLHAVKNGTKNAEAFTRMMETPFEQCDETCIASTRSDAVNVVTEFLEWVNACLKNKEAHLNLKSSERADQRQKDFKMNRVIQPVALVSRQTPDEAIKAVMAEQDVEVDISMPSFRADLLGVNEVSVKKALRAASIDGPRVCEVYPDVIWEAVFGPIDHAMDIDREDKSIQSVVIAPRRTAGMGVDLSQARMLLVDEYESYFSPFVAD